jgi:hypothetical protein
VIITDSGKLYQPERTGAAASFPEAIPASSLEVGTSFKSRLAETNREDNNIDYLPSRIIRSARLVIFHLLTSCSGN